MFQYGERLLIVSFCVSSVYTVELGPGTPVPHADELKRMIIKYIFDRPSDINGDAILDFLTGKSATIPNPEEEFMGLNISVLDPEGIKKVTQLAKEKQWDELIKKEVNTSKISRRTALNQWESSWQAWYTELDGPKGSRWRMFVQTGIDFMHQAMYATRYNLKRTKPLRKKYQNSYMFHIGTQFGMLMQMRIKMETCQYMIEGMNPRNQRFYWFLIIYHKVLQAHMDITMTVRRMFELYKALKKKRNNPIFMYAYKNR